MYELTRKFTVYCVIATTVAGTAAVCADEGGAEWISLFNGKNLDAWVDNLDVCLARCVMDESAHTAGTENLWRIRGTLLGMRRASISRAAREEHALYGTSEFPFAALDMYQVSLNGVRWIQQFVEELERKRRPTRRRPKQKTRPACANSARLSA